MTATTKARRPKPPEPPMAGLAYFPVPDPKWRAAQDGARCRDHAGARSGYGSGPHCGEPASAEADTGHARSPWYGYCAEHAAARGHWTEDGQVMAWVLRHGDGTPLTPQEEKKALAVLAARDRGVMCAKHHRPRAGCDPWWRHTRSMRWRDDTYGDAEIAADAASSDVTSWITQAVEARLGFVRCYRCRDDAPPVPLEAGDLTGMTFGEALTAAVREAERQHPAHEPVWLGAQPVPAEVEEEAA